MWWVEEEKIISLPILKEHSVKSQKNMEKEEKSINRAGSCVFGN